MINQIPADDLGGAGLGSSQSASYRAFEGAPPVSVEAAPASGNAFLYAANDRGSLNSEFFVAWRIRPTVLLRAGLSHILTEYRLSEDPGSGARRYRRFSNLAFAALRWTP